MMTELEKRRRNFHGVFGVQLHVVPEVGPRTDSNLSSATIAFRKALVFVKNLRYRTVLSLSYPMHPARALAGTVRGFDSKSCRKMINVLGVAFARHCHGGDLELA